MLPPLPIIFLWPLMVMVFFKNFKTTIAISVSIIGGYLLLPIEIGFDLPVLPAFTKDSIPSFAVLCLLLLLPRVSVGESLKGWFPTSLIGRVLVFGAVFGIFMTVMTNGERLVFQVNSIQGLRPYDFFASGLSFLVTILPFLIARKFLATAEAHKSLLMVLAISGLGYSVLAGYEIRMSPQLNNFFYGYYPKGWIQNLRDGGFRPFVFLGHGLKLGIFMACAILAALALARRGDPRRRVFFWFAFFWMFGILFFSKAFGAFLITTALIFVVFLVGPRLQMIAAAIIAGSVLLYPMLRGADLVPVDQAVAWAKSVDADRGGSLQFRLNNEDILLEKALAKPIFGWGGWSRARVYNENGNDVSTTDGTWIIIIGEGGWVGYVSWFGLLCGPIIFLAWRKSSELGPETAALSIVLAANLMDLIPNSGLTPVTWLVAGALMGRYEAPRSGVIDSATPEIQQDTIKPSYSRTPPRTPNRLKQQPHETRGATAGPKPAGPRNLSKAVR